MRSCGRGRNPKTVSARGVVALAAAALIGGVSPSAPGADKACAPGIISTVAGDGWVNEDGQGRYSADGGPAAEASLWWPFGVAVGADGSIYVGDSSNDRVRKVDADGIITTVAGNGDDGYSGDSGPATRASLRSPHGIALGPDGSLYIADGSNHRIRRVDAAGVITTVAGTGERGFSGDGSPAVQARLNRPYDVTCGADGSLYIADLYSHRIRRVDADGIITTVAGDGWAGGERGSGRYKGDRGPAVEASLNAPTGVAVAPDGSLYIADQFNHRVRRVGTDGIITTVAGNGRKEYSGDGGPAARAGLASPSGVAVDAEGRIYIGDAANHRVRRVDQAGTITTVAGDGYGGYWGDGGTATEASLQYPFGVAFGADGALYVADGGNHLIRRIRWRPCDPEAAKAAADELAANAGDSQADWREAVELYIIAQAWDDALAAAEQAAAAVPETNEDGRLRAAVLSARVYAAKGDDHEARRRLIRVMARGRTAGVLREAAGLLVKLYLRRNERDQAIATLGDLRLRTDDRDLLRWIDRRLKAIAGD